MADEGGPGRRPRADAERNRARLLATAKAAFAEKGSAASLDEIARTAGVGAGTLYRHFPTRDALIEAVYRNETDQLVAAAVRLADAQAPVAALRHWLLLFVDYMATKHGMSEALNSIVGGASDLYAASGTKVKRTIADLVERATASGDIRLDMDPLDLLRALAGVERDRGSGFEASRETPGGHPDRGDPGAVNGARPFAARASTTGDAAAILS